MGKAGNRLAILDKIQNEAAKLIAIVRIRQDLSRLFPGCEFLLPTQTDPSYVVGIRFQGKVILAEEKSFWKAYHRLLKQAVWRIS